MQTGARQHFRFFGGRALGERPHAHAAGVRRAEAGDVGERALHRIAVDIALKQHDSVDTSHGRYLE